MKNIKRRLTPQPLKIRADVDMTCYAYDGVLHIQVSAGLATIPCVWVCLRKLLHLDFWMLPGRNALPGASDQMTAWWQVFPSKLLAEQRGSHGSTNRTDPLALEMHLKALDLPRRK